MILALTQLQDLNVAIGSYFESHIIILCENMRVLVPKWQEAWLFS